MRGDACDATAADVPERGPHVPAAAVAARVVLAGLSCMFAPYALAVRCVRALGLAAGAAHRRRAAAAAQSASAAASATSRRRIRNSVGRANDAADGMIPAASV